MVMFLGGGTVGLPGNVPGGTTALGGDLLPATSVVQHPNVYVLITNQFDGQTYQLNHVLDVSIIYGFDVQTSSATVSLTEVGGTTAGQLTADFSKYSRVQIFCSADTAGRIWPPGTPLFNGEPKRFDGLYLRTEATLDPHVWSMVCRGNLYFADQYRQALFTVGLTIGVPSTLLTPQLGQNVPIGQILFGGNYAPGESGQPSGFPSGMTLTSGAAPTDENIFQMILSQVKDSFPGLSFAPADIQGTGRIFGTINWRQMAWPPYMSAIEFLQQWDEVCLGYRLFETMGGRIVRLQVYGYPTIPSGDLVALAGTVTKTAGQRTLNGSGTAFTTQVSVGSLIQVPGGGFVETLSVQTVTSDTLLSVNEPWVGSASGQTASLATGIEFTEGVDIWEGRGSRSVEQLINACYVDGAATPDVQAGLVYAYIQQSNPFQQADLTIDSDGNVTVTGQPVVEQFSSQWIEGIPLDSGGNFAPNDPTATSNPGDPLNPVDVANWRLAERNRELVNIQFTTFRDDLLWPGLTILVVSPHMALTEPVWLQRVELRMTAQPVSFTQTLYGYGGGLNGYAADLPTPPTSPLTYPY